MLTRNRPSYLFVMMLILGAVLLSQNVFAQDEEIKNLDQLLAATSSSKQQIADLDKRLEGAEGFIEKALRSRLIKARIALLENNLAYANAVADAEEAGDSNEKHRQLLIERAS